MSFLDGLFLNTVADIEVSETPIGDDATVEPGFLYLIDCTGDDIALTIATHAAAEVSGKRLAVKVATVDPDGGELSVTVPDGQQIENDEGQLVEAFGISSMELGDYREWLCDADGIWRMVVGGTGDGGGVIVVDEDDELRAPASRITLRNSDTVTFTVSTDEDNNGVFVDAEATAPAVVVREPIQAFWWYPATPHSEDREMEENTNAPPAGWTAGIFNTSGSVWGAGTNDGNVDPLIQVPAGHYRISCGSRRRSWMQLQANGTQTVVVYRLITAAPGSTLQLRVRLSSHQLFNGSPASGASLFFYITPDDGASKPDLSVTNGTRVGVLIPPAATTNDFRLNVTARNGGADKIAAMTFPNNAFQGSDFEFVYETAVSNGSGQKARLYVRNDAGMYQPLEAGTGSPPYDDAISNRLHNGLPVYVAFRLQQVGSNPLVSAVDYFRRVDAAFSG